MRKEKAYFCLIHPTIDRTKGQEQDTLQKQQNRDMQHSFNCLR